MIRRTHGKGSLVSYLSLDGTTVVSDVAQGRNVIPFGANVTVTVVTFQQ